MRTSFLVSETLLWPMRTTTFAKSLVNGNGSSKEILTWQTKAELEILNADNESQGETWNRLVASKKSEVSDKITDQQEIMKQKLQDYYKRKDRHVNLIEKYKTDFLNSINSLANEIKHSACTKLDCFLELKLGSKKAQEIQRKCRGEIEERVIKLLTDCKDSTLSDEQLKQEFEKMWAKATENVPRLKERDIPACILNQLRKKFSNRNVNENLLNLDELKEIGKDQFKTRSDHIDSFRKRVQHMWSRDLQNFADSVIEICTQLVLDKAKTNGDYHESFTRDLLEKVDECLKQSYMRYKTNTQFEIDLKLHICGIASREFLKMHQKFLSDNDPQIQLEKYKSQYLSDFIDLYKQTDDCQRKATDFVTFCIKPAVEEYISRSLGIDIVDEILTSCHSAEYSSRSFFQYNIQKELMQKQNFKSFVKYICKYEIYVKDWIFQHILQQMDNTLCKLKNKNLQVIVHKITEAIERASKGEDGVLLSDNKESITELINNMRKYLIKDISISVEAEKTTLFQIQSTLHPFINSLKISIEDLKKQLHEEFSNSEEITETLNILPIKPQDVLFKRVFGCGQLLRPCLGGKERHINV
ncbi:interferon-induced very large GTPase 1-like [Dicentrarchus labrax]|uniref:interferon-induced very large GTPase 1-like n=1 Tax=Dicentrarchus labrax TaxID=13489 RepID=UPI0021F57CF4|nr:interferon-induced very large GTPase 1-like [Dicentrarchus labrax]